MPKAKQKTLTDEVISVAKAIRRGPLSWHERLPPKTHAEIVAMRSRLHDGTIGVTQTALAKSLEATLKRRGLPSPKWGEIAKWLAR